MKSEIVEAFSQIAKEKNIEKELLGEILESTILSIINPLGGAWCAAAELEVAIYDVSPGSRTD